MRIVVSICPVAPTLRRVESAVQDGTGRKARGMSSMMALRCVRSPRGLGADVISVNKERSGKGDEKREFIGKKVPCKPEPTQQYGRERGCEVRKKGRETGRRQNTPGLFLKSDTGLESHRHAVRRVIRLERENHVNNVGTDFSRER
ncbi:hypothetical protein K438DRAFT_1753327 [Mycena galopus ATCC 62051]|nr:hypothetical protein K438DRAFT_1753327 [Mycena galopus ATCC 62051]